MREIVEGNHFWRILGLFLIGIWIERNQFYIHLEKRRKMLTKVFRYSLAVGLPYSLLYSWSVLEKQPVGLTMQSAFYLMGTYLVLTFAELLLSPMGISFVSKVAPPKYKGLMMGLWFAATAVGNYLSSIPGLLWMQVPLWANWAILMALCVIAGFIMFAMLKKIEAATEDKQEAAEA